MNGFTVQAEGARQSLLSSRWFRLLFPVLIALVMGCGVLGFGIYRQYRDSLRRPWIEAESSPNGATVFLNGRFVGATPLRLEHLEAGTYALRFEKDGHEPAVRQVQLEKPGSRVTVQMALLSSGRLVVNVEPKGAEVLLDGVLVGHTPLTVGAVAGPHELVVRRTNYQPLVRRLNLKPDETQTFAGLALQDLVLRAMQERCRLEPWRISNATELATYLFLTGRQPQAAEVSIQAIDAAVRTPVFPPEFLPDDRANEMRLRSDDMGRLNHMLARMWSWPGHDTAPYRERMEKSDARLKMLSFRLRLHSWDSAYQTATQLLQGHGKDPETLYAAVREIAGGKAHTKEGDARALLTVAEKMAQAAYAADRSVGALAMAEMATLRGASGEALNYLRESLAQQSPENAWEDRALRAVTLYRELGQRDPARTICERLVKSGRPEIRDPATELLKALR